jgi:hypothetical protein
MAEIVISSLPLETQCPPFLLRQYGGFWMPESFLPGVAAAHRQFKPRPSDVLLASFPKSGTTWLKALAFATLNRVKHPPRHPDHPPCRCNPHVCVKYLESDAYGDVLQLFEPQHHSHGPPQQPSPLQDRSHTITCRRMLN